MTKESSIEILLDPETVKKILECSPKYIEGSKKYLQAMKDFAKEIRLAALREIYKALTEEGLVNLEDLFKKLGLDIEEAKSDYSSYFNFLNDLRESGSINMFAAASVLEKEFRLPKEEAIKVFKEWCKQI
jgi:thiaminase